MPDVTPPQACPLPPPVRSPFPVRPGLLLLLFFLGAYAAFICWHATFGVIDDHLFFNNDLWKNGFYITIDVPSGRFLPLNGLPFALLTHWGLLSAPLFYAMQAALFLACALVLRRLLGRYGYGDWTILAVSLLLFLSPAFTNTIYRLYLAELPLMLLGLLLAFALPDTEKACTRPRVLAVLALATAMLYYKECMVVPVTVLSLVAIGQGLATGQRRLSRLYGLLLADAAVYLLVYYFCIHLKKNAADYLDGRQIGVWSTLLFYLENDTLLLVGLVGGLLWRLGRWRRGERTVQSQDLLFIGALSLTGFYVLLRIPASYYLLPAYALALPLGAAAGRHLGWAAFSGKRRLALAAAVLALAANTLVPGLHALTQTRAVYQNYQDFLNHLALLATAGDHSRPVLLLLPGLTAKDEAAHSLRMRLEARRARVDVAFPPVEELVDTILALPPDRQAVVALTPYSQRTLAVDGWLYAALQPLFASEQGLVTPQGTFGGLIRQARAAALDRVPESAGRQAASGSDFFLFTVPARLGPDILPFDLSQLQLTVPDTARAKEHAGTVTVRVANAAKRPFIAALHNPASDMRLLALRIGAHNSLGYAGEARLPARLEPGAFAEVSLPVRSGPAAGPAVLAVLIGFTHNGRIFFASNHLDVVLPWPGTSP